MYSKDLLKQQIEKKAFGVLDVSKSIRVNRQVVYLKDVLGLLDGYVCIDRKDLEEGNSKAEQYLSQQKAKFGFKVTSNLGFWEGYLKHGKELLEK